MFIALVFMVQAEGGSYVATNKTDCWTNAPAKVCETVYYRYDVDGQGFDIDSVSVSVVNGSGLYWNPQVFGRGAEIWTPDQTVRWYANPDQTTISHSGGSLTFTPNVDLPGATGMNIAYYGTANVIGGTNIPFTLKVVL